MSKLHQSNKITYFTFRSKRNKNEGGLTLKQPLEYRLMHALSIGGVAFLAAFMSFSIFAPVQITDAAEVLLAAQTNGSTVSIETGSTPINLSLQAGSSGAITTAPDIVKVTAGSTGYQLYLSTVGTETALTRIDGSGDNGNSNSTANIPTLSSSGTPVSLLSPTNLENNTWGYALSGSSNHLTTDAFSTNDYTDPSNAANKFAGIPAKGNEVKIAAHNSTTNAEPITIYYGAKVTSAIPSGTYGNTIVYTAIGNATTENLASVTPERTNQLSGGELLTISTPSTTALSSIASVNVTVGNATCTNPIAAKNDNGTGALTNVTCTSPALATGWHEVIVTITTTADTTETYVVNPGIEYYTADGILAMQDFTEEMCLEMNILDNILLTDSRDDNTYKVTKQKDGNCWMTENLRLGTTADGTGIQNITLTSANSDITGESRTLVQTVTSDNTTSDIQTGGNRSWTSPVDAYHVYSFAGTSDATTYGNLYNWYTATAGTGTSVMTSGDAESSICPKGWQLPPNTGNGSYTNLMTAQIPGIPTSSVAGAEGQVYTSQFVASPLSFVLSGLYGSGLSNQGSASGYWFRTTNSADDARDFGFVANGYFGLQGGSRKYYGFTVRCVLVP